MLKGQVTYIEEYQKLVSKMQKNAKIYDEVVLTGRLYDLIQEDHKSCEGIFYKTKIAVKRYSETRDYIPIVFHESLLPYFMEGEGTVKIHGFIATHNIKDETGRHLKVDVYVNEVQSIYKFDDTVEDMNFVYIRGFLCKVPNYRLTKKGKEITDLCIAIDTEDGESFYIPTISWQNKARYAKYFKVGDSVELLGRVQSRQYFKRSSPDSEEGEYKNAYEVSVVSFLK